MKASEFIAELKDNIDIYGDLPVLIEDGTEAIIEHMQKDEDGPEAFVIG